VNISQLKLRSEKFDDDDDDNNNNNNNNNNIINGRVDLIHHDKRKSDVTSKAVQFFGSTRAHFVKAHGH